MRKAKSREGGAGRGRGNGRGGDGIIIFEAKERLFFFFAPNSAGIGLSFSFHECFHDDKELWWLEASFCNI